MKPSGRQKSTRRTPLASERGAVLAAVQETIDAGIMRDLLLQGSWALVAGRRSAVVVMHDELSVELVINADCIYHHAARIAGLRRRFNAWHSAIMKPEAPGSRAT